jgi:ribbon-helix-helix CopG family protein
MKRTTVMLPDDLDGTLRIEAQRRGLSIAELVREAVDAYVTELRRPKRLSFIGIGEGPADLAERADDYLADTFDEQAQRDASS